MAGIRASSEDAGFLRRASCRSTRQPTRIVGGSNDRLPGMGNKSTLPTRHPQIHDPEGESVMVAVIEAGVESRAAYNGIQGVESMSSDDVIAELEVMNAEVMASFDAFEASISASFDAFEASFSTSSDSLESTIEAFAANTSARFDALDAKLDLLTVFVFANLAIVTAIAVAGLFRRSGWRLRRKRRNRQFAPR